MSQEFALSGEICCELEGGAAITRLSAALSKWKIPRPGGGLSLWCRMPEPISMDLVSAAERQGLLILPGSWFSHRGAGLDRILRLPFNLPDEVLDAAVARLKRAWREVSGSLARGGMALKDRI